MFSSKNKPVTQTALPVHLYAPNIRLSFRGILKTIAKEFPVAHSLGFRFAERNIRARYRQSVLGILWALLPPLATAAIWIILQQNNIVLLKNTGENYALFVITGTMLWSVFSNAVLMPIQTIQANTGILVKINFPREALMITAFYEILFNTAVALIIIVAEVLFFQVPVSLHSLVFFPAIILLIVMGMAIGLLILPLAMLYKDIQFVLPTFLQFAMYLTPVVYATPVFSGAAKILTLNPVSPVLTFGRDGLLGLNTAIDFGQLGLIAFAAIVVLTLGIILQRIAIEILIERMGT